MKFHTRRSVFEGVCTSRAASFERENGKGIKIAEEEVKEEKRRFGDSGRLFPAISNPLPRFHPSVPEVDYGAMHHP